MYKVTWEIQHVYRHQQAHAVLRILLHILQGLIAKHLNFIKKSNISVDLVIIVNN